MPRACHWSVPNDAIAFGIWKTTFSWTHMPVLGKPGLGSNGLKGPLFQRQMNDLRN